MVQLRLILRLVLLATLRTAECSSDELGAMSQGRKISKASERASHPVKPGFVPYRGSFPNLLLSTTVYADMRVNNKYKCGDLVDDFAAQYWIRGNVTLCYLGHLDTPVCRVENASETGHLIMESFLTNGSPNDDPFPNFIGRNQFMNGKPNIAFRVMTPTILEFPEFTTKIAFHPPKTAFEIINLPLPEKIFVFPKLGGIVATDDSILVDPSCHTNNLCGVPFLTTSVEAVKTPHVALDQYCGQTIDLNDTQVLNVFSHTGIGCKAFPDVYPTPNCELTITSPSAITANVTLVNFRKPTCQGYELLFVNFTCEGVSKEVDVCQEDTPTVFDSSEGKMQIKLTGSASENLNRYGFIIRLEKVAKSDNSSRCSSDNSSEGTNSDFPEVSTTAPAGSPTNSTLASATLAFSHLLLVLGIKL